MCRGGVELGSEALPLLSSLPRPFLSKLGCPRAGPSVPRGVHAPGGVVQLAVASLLLAPLLRVGKPTRLPAARKDRHLGTDSCPARAGWAG